jgi:hypothetical protein
MGTLWAVPGEGKFYVVLTPSGYWSVGFPLEYSKLPKTWQTINVGEANG